MPIKISSINIRRLYSEEELALADSIRNYQSIIDDTKTLEKLRQLKNFDIVPKEDYSELTVEEFSDRMLTQTYNNPDKKYRDRKKIDNVKTFIEENKSKVDKEQLNDFSRNDENLRRIRKEMSDTSNKLKISLGTNTKVRELRLIYESDYIAISESSLTESIKIEKDSTSNKIIIITSDQGDMMKNIIDDGFMYKGEKYELYGASAGQLRKKKLMFIHLDSLIEALPKLINGLDVNKINNTKVGEDDEGRPIYGVNINKWSAYMSLPTSSTEIWEEVDLDRVCVVDDFETTLIGREVDHIDDNYEIERIIKDIDIPHTDGFGMMHPNFCRDTRMVRAPWIKGLVAPMDYRSFARTFKGKEIIKDIWGEPHDINELDMILTKSQFKMWKYYDSWGDYKTKFKENNCEFRYMIPESKKDLRLNAKFNYQMWNTLEIQDKKEFANNVLKEDKKLIKRAHREVGAMLNMFHVDKVYIKNNYLKKALYLYPAMLKTEGFKTTLKNNIAARKKEMRQGRIKVNGVYTFLIPDTFAWCERLLLDIENPKGLLADGEVSCKLVNKNKEILVNRSPHLYLEHCVRKNIKEKEHIRWFIGKGVYTSTHDPISKQLFFDVDGDIALVVENDKIIEIAKETMKDIVPLDFRLEKAPAQIINKDNIYESYNLAFTANIGYYSNLITKVMNSDYKDRELVAKICWINNQVIDFAKTKWLLKPTEELANQLESLDKRKLPYFFIWAKDKKRSSVAVPNKNSVVDMMAESVDEHDRDRYFYKNIETFDIGTLLLNVNVTENNELIDKFKNLANNRYHSIIRKKVDGDRNFKDNYLNNHIISEMYEYLSENNISVDDAVDCCVKYVFEKNRDRDVLFIIFGNVIVDRLEQRFPQLVDGSFVRCDVCGKMIMNTNGKNSYCEDCKKKVKKEQDRLANQRYRKKR